MVRVYTHFEIDLDLAALTLSTTVRIHSLELGCMFGVVWRNGGV